MHSSLPYDFREEFGGVILAEPRITEKHSEVFRSAKANYIDRVLDGFEGAPYKRVHKVQLFGGQPLN